MRVDCLQSGHPRLPDSYLRRFGQQHLGFDLPLVSGNNKLSFAI